ncbi:BON domain-containing protein [Bailinhaonella thermotolerans]|uniref:BON domain-containing protein n=1 Tax=Bailinhaonella thermotolerans TaxID=1070861 RepID=UPI001F5BD22A|nr:BON domain-containing protein [Bailinhaonella thermotolerans]
METNREPHYLSARVRERLTEDERTAEQGLQVVVRGDVIYLRGTVASEERRRRIEEVAAEICPDHEIRDETTLIDLHRPEGEERLP